MIRLLLSLKNRGIKNGYYMQKYLFSSERFIANDGKTFEDFFDKPIASKQPKIVYDPIICEKLKSLSFAIETYGCQMNKADSNIMDTLLKQCGMVPCIDEEAADVIIMNTCSVREHAESRIWNRLSQFRHLDKKYRRHTILCVSGCMASRLHDKLLQEGVDVIVGPDSYTRLPPLLVDAMSGHQVTDIDLNPSETYPNITPLLTDPQPCTQITITRGCNNMCSYCVVPYTRGRERSVPIQTVLDDVSRVRDNGYKEILLLGQNVNSYCDESNHSHVLYESTPGFSTSSSRLKKGILFPELLERIAETAPEVRIRFMSPHPKDFPLSVLEVIKSHPNICRSIHLPLQSGSNSCLLRMNRPYSREAFLDLAHRVRETLPDCALSTDIITGFCGETEEEHRDTLSLMREIGFDNAFMYMFSMRENTFAWKHYIDDVELEVKKRRLIEIQDCYYSTLKEKLNKLEGRYELVLVEGESRRSTIDNKQFKGRCDSDRMCVFDDIPLFSSVHDYRKGEKKNESHVVVGDYIACQMVTPGPGTHILKPLFKSSISEYAKVKNYLGC